MKEIESANQKHLTNRERSGPGENKLFENSMVKVFINYRKILLLALIIFFIMFSVNSQAQTLRRQSVSSYCTIITKSNASIEQTAGQPYNTIVFSDPKVSVLPGFQQPIALKTENLSPEFVRSFEIRVYPNPANEYVSIKSEEPIEDFSIRILDCKGRLIISGNAVHLQPYILDCSALPNGIYLIIVSDNFNRISSSKLIISK